MVREIIDDTNYMEDEESNSEKSKNDEKNANSSNEQEVITPKY